MKIKTSPSSPLKTGGASTAHKSGGRLNLDLCVCLLLSGCFFIMFFMQVVFGESHAYSATFIETLTSRGRFFFKPENDMKIYLVMCLVSFACATGGGLLWLRRSRLMDTEPDAKTQKKIQTFHIVFLAWALMVLLEAGSLVYWDEPSLCRPRGIIVFMLFTAAMLMIQRMDRGPVTRKWLLDILMLLLIPFVVYIADVPQVIRQAFFVDNLHHWDYYYMGATIGFANGRALHSEVYSQYSTVWPMLLSWLLPGERLGYAPVLRLFVIYGCFYYLGIYCLLRLLTKSRGWAAAGSMLTILLHLFHGTNENTMWIFPSSTIIRSPLDVWFFIFLFLYLKERKTAWAAACALLAGNAMAFELDTGIYQAVIAAIFIPLPWFITPCETRTVSQLLQKLGCLALIPAALLAWLAIAARGQMNQAAFWRGWLEPITDYGKGLSGIPFKFSFYDSNMICSHLVYGFLFILYMHAVVRVAIRVLRKQDLAPIELTLAAIAAYGLAILLLFINRSHQYNLYHTIVPASIIFCCRLWQFNEILDSEENGGISWAISRLQAIVTAAIMAGYVVSLPFSYYPSLCKLPFQDRSAPLTENEPRVCRLIQVAGGHQRVEQIKEVCEYVEECKKQGQSFSILGSQDTLIYLATNSKPWFRYSPLLCTFMNKSPATRQANTLLENSPDIALLSTYETNSADVAQIFRKVLVTRYHRVKNVGQYEVWQINEK